MERQLVREKGLESLILKECAFISGGRGSGKSTLAMGIVDSLRRQNYQVKVIDGSLVWRRKSSLPFFVKVLKPTNQRLRLPNLWNTIYDISRLTVWESREFVNSMLATDVEEAIILTEVGFKIKAVVVLEECQNLIPSGSLRSQAYGEISRFVCQGRNFGLGYIALTQRLASCDTTLVEISGLKYWGKLEGENTVRKAKAWLSKDQVKMTRDFKVGTFLMTYGSKALLVKGSDFEAEILPVQYQKPKRWQWLRKVLTRQSNQITIENSFLRNSLQGYYVLL